MDLRSCDKHGLFFLRVKNMTTNRKGDDLCKEPKTSRSRYNKLMNDRRRAIDELPFSNFLKGEHSMKRFLAVLCALLFFLGTAYAYDDTNIEGHFVTVTTRLLNGRMTPNKNAMKTAFFDKGMVVEMTGRWSDDHDWVEVIAGEAGNCWVARQYVTERTDPFTVYNRDFSKVKIRKKPHNKSKVTGYLRKGHEIEITKVILGWGKCRLGWIDLYYVEEEED